MPLSRIYQIIKCKINIIRLLQEVYLAYNLGVYFFIHTIVFPHVNSKKLIELLFPIPSN
jgi:hypothetical protein